MEWLTGIEWMDGRPHGSVISSTREDLVSLADLHVRGLPPPSTGAHRKVTLDLADLEVLSPGPELVAAGVDSHVCENNRHDAFAFDCDGLRFVVPALLLMRELFAPARFLLPEMFRPQALDHISRIDYAHSVPRLILDAHWVPKSSVLRHRSPLETLTWLHAFPSARRMVASVFEAAQAGRLSMVLPRAKATMGLRGIECGQVTLVTSLNLQVVEPSEQPTLHFEHMPSSIAFRPAGWSRGKARCASRPVIPTMADGSVQVTDAEWERIREFLLVARTGRKSTHCRRAMLDGILEKHSTGKSWELCQYPVGTWMNAAQTYRDWSKRGDFDRVLQVLEESRVPV